MKKRTLTVKDRQRKNGGAFGTYYKLSPRRGVKVLDAAYDTIKEAKQSVTYRAAKEEAWLLKKAYKSKITPKCYGIKIVEVDGYYSVGIVMTHMGDLTLSEFMRTRKAKKFYHRNIEGELLKKLDKVGITHCDLHNHNIMVRGNKFYAIDFSPENIHWRANA